MIDGEFKLLELNAKPNADRIYPDGVQWVVETGYGWVGAYDGKALQAFALEVLRLDHQRAKAARPSPAESFAACSECACSSDAIRMAGGGCPMKKIVDRLLQWPVVRPGGACKAAPQSLLAATAPAGHKAPPA